MAFGKPKKVEESINDKFVRLFKEGKTVEQISKEFDVKPDVIANVIRRRLGNDAIPETVVRSKNAVPHPESDPPKTEPAAPAPAAESAAEPEPAAVKAEISEEGLSKLEQFMLEKEKKKAEEPVVPAEESSDPELGVMESIYLDEDAINAKLGGEAPPSPNMPMVPESNDADNDMAGLVSEEISEDAVIKEAPIDAYSEPDIVVEEPVIPPEPEIASYEPIVELGKPAETEKSAAPAAEPAPAQESAPAPKIEVPHGNGSAFDKMKAFAKMQLAANNDKLAELEAKIAGVEGEYTTQLAEAEKAVGEAKVAYEEVIRKGDSINERRDALNDEHRTALARAEADYQRKLKEADEEYNNATARANREFAEKQDTLNAEIDQIDALKEEAKQDFLTKQREVNHIKEKISSDVDSVKAEIESLREENKGYESFLN
ncbi:MAG: hypothetical protein K6B74_03385 [Ruminococcus sp.]|nr:hypothetical protein [Ruminococcus sp.]